MKVCSSCEASNLPDARFCSSCGESLVGELDLFLQQAGLENLVAVFQKHDFSSPAELLSLNDSDFTELNILLGDRLRLQKALEGFRHSPSQDRESLEPSVPVNEEQHTFHLVLVSAGEDKISAIKALRSVLPGLGLADAKALVDSAPALLREFASASSANAAKEMLEAFGAAARVIASGESRITEEQRTFDLILVSAGENKISAIKALRSTVPDLGLAGAMALVDDAPILVRKFDSASSANTAKEILEAIGATARVIASGETTITGEVVSPMRDDLQSRLDEQFSKLKSLDRIYVAPDIPSSKLTAALKSYVRKSDVEALLLYDVTVFGGAKDGLVVAKDGLYIKESFEPSCYFPYNSIRSVDVRDETKLQINGKQVMSCIGIAPISLRRIVQVIVILSGLDK